MTKSEADTPTSWPFREAERVVHRLHKSGKSTALFETGYGPSGLPHIGTFMEVARTSWIRLAFTRLTGLPSKLLAFSDDMDALRKVPGNVPQQDMLREFIGQRQIFGILDTASYTNQNIGSGNIHVALFWCQYLN